MANSRNGKEDVVDTLLDAKICGAPRPDSAPKFTSNGGVLDTCTAAYGLN